MTVTKEQAPKALDIGFKYEGGVHTPTVLVGFAPDDWAARDRFVRQFIEQSQDSGHAPAPTDEQIDALILSIFGEKTATSIMREVYREFARAALALAAPAPATSSILSDAAARICTTCGLPATEFPCGHPCRQDTAGVPPSDGGQQ